ncbi:MAG: hypothetical protein FWH55_13410 [Oscillospiraceae bacterium]|nr:hypothetical protein [Oscillospiraceae bacterium]
MPGAEGRFKDNDSNDAALGATPTPTPKPIPVRRLKMTDMRGMRKDYYKSNIERTNREE